MSEPTSVTRAAAERWWRSWTLAGVIAGIFSRPPE
jgi:hypothetical protein